MKEHGCLTTHLISSMCDSGAAQLISGIPEFDPL